MATATKIMQQKTALLAQDLVQRFNDRELDDLDGIIARNVECVNVPFDATLRGPSGYREYNELWLEAFPDARMKVNRAIDNAEYVVLEFEGRGTHKGPLQVPSGTIAATNKKINMQFCEVLHFENGKLDKVTLYFDFATMLRQLGLAAGK